MLKIKIKFRKFFVPGKNDQGYYIGAMIRRRCDDSFVFGSRISGRISSQDPLWKLILMNTRTYYTFYGSDNLI